MHMRAINLLGLVSLIFVLAGGLFAQSPTEPTTLFVDSDDAQAGTQGDPVNGINTTPYFSAIFNHDTPSALAAEARVQFATDAAFTNIVATSTWKAIAATAVGARIPDIQYTGSALDCVSQYFWRIRIKDALGIIGPWSTEAASFNTVACPHDATTLYVGNDEAQTGTQGDSVSNINMKPVFSAVMIHDSPTATAAEAKVQFATDAAFTNVVASSAWQAVTPVTTGNRSSDIEYNGTALACNTRYYWRIKFKDNVGVVGPWSTEPASFVTVHCPLEATTLFIGNTEAQTGTQGDPVNLINIQPYCSAIVTHSNPAATVVEAKVQFALDPAFTNKLGTSSWKSITPTTAGNRSSDIRYNGQAVPGSTRVYWRIRYRDSAGVVGHWSTEIASFETVPSPVEPTILFVDSANAQAGSQGNPATGIDLDPVFSAIFNHNDTGGIASAARVEVAADAAFTNEVWNSGWQSITATADGARISDVAMPTGLLTNSTTYFWRVRIEDTSGNKGPWSTEPASFTTAGTGGSVPASLATGGLLQGTETVTALSKTGGSPFVAGVSVSFDAAEISVTQVTVTGPDTLQLTISTGNRAPYGTRTFQVMDGPTVVAQGETVVFHPLQRRPSRLASAAQETLNSPMVLGAGVTALQGEFVYGATDVSIRGRKLPLGFHRTYRSFLGYNGATGQSWASAIDTSMRYSSSLEQIEWLNSDGRISTLYLIAGGQAGVGPYVEDGRYIEWIRSDGGTPSDLTDDMFTGTSAHGDLTRFSYGGLDHTGEAVYRLVSLEDRFGNRIEYVRDSWAQLVEIRGDLYDQAEPTRHRLTLQYGQDGRLSRILDYSDNTAEETHLGSSFLGARAWDYIYSSAGDLIEIRGPATRQHGEDNAGATGRTRSLYAYFAESAQGHHLLRQLYLPVQANLELSANTGVPWLSNEYDASYRVVTQDLGAESKTDASHRHHLKYNGSTVDEIDPLGRRTTVQLDSVGRPLQISRHTGTFSLDQFGIIQTGQAKLRASDPDVYATVFEYNQQGELTRLVLPRENERRWLYDHQNSSHRARGNLLRVASLPGTVDTSSLPAAQRNGMLVTYGYEATFNLPTEEVAADAYDLNAGFDITLPLTNQLARDDSQIYRTVFEYDALGRLTRVSAPAVTTTHSPGSPNVGQQFIREFQYNAFGQVTASRDMSSYPAGYAGVSVDYEYGTSGFDRGYLTARVVDATGLNERVEFTYNSVGELRTQKAPHGALQTTIHDQLGRVVKSISPAISSLGGLQYTVDFTWDQNGNLAQRVIHDPVLDAQGQPTAVIRDVSAQWTYGVFGNVVSSTESVTAQSTRTSTRVYDAAYQLIETRSPGGTKSVFTYDELGRPFQSFFGLAFTAAPAQAIASTRVDYDINGNVERTTDPRGFQRTSVYDAYDRLFTADDARAPITTRVAMTYSHGAAPAEVLITGDDGAGNRVTLAQRREWMDNMGRVFRAADWAVAADRSTPLGYAAGETGSNDTPGWSVSTYSLLPDGRALSAVGDLLDGSGPSTSTQLWTMEYDAAGRTSRILDPVGNIREYTYVNARLTEEYEHSIDTGTQAMETSRIAYGYDEISRVISKQACTQDPVLFRYDARNNVAHVTDPRSGVVRFEYDLANRMLKQTRSASGLWALSTTPTLSTGNSASIESVFEYDLDSNLTRAIDNAGNQTTYAYDLAGRLLQSHFANGGKATVGTSHTLTAVPGTTAYFETTGGYDASGNLLQMLDEGGNQITRTFSPEGEVLNMQITKGQNSLIAGTSGVTWQYDGLGRVLQMTTSQFGGGTHVRTHAWNSMSLLESYSEQIDSGPQRPYLRHHDEAGRNYATQSPDTTVTWVRDLLGRMKSYRVTRTGHTDIEGAWTYFGRGGLRTARAVSGDEDIEVQRDRRGRMLGVSSVSRAAGGATRNPNRYLYDPQTGRLEGMLSLDRPVVSGESRIGQPTDPSFGSSRVFGTRTFFDGFGRVTGYASEVSYSQSATDASGWSAHPDTHAMANEFDSVDFPTESGIFFGQQFMNGSGVGHFETSHATNYGSTSSPLAQGDGSRFVPNAVGDVNLEKTSDDHLKIADDGSNAYIYDFQGRVVRTSRVSDGAVISERQFDGTGIVYNHEINEYCLVDKDFAAPNLSGVSITTSNVRFDGGGLHFTGTTANEFVQFSFPADIKRNAASAIQGGSTSYHDFLLHRNSSSPFLCNFRFIDYQNQFAQFRLEVTGTTLKLHFRPHPDQPETLLAQGSWPAGSNGPVNLGVRFSLSATTDIDVFSGGTSILSHSYNGPGGAWAPTNVLFEAGADTTRLYRYKGYLDLDFSQSDLRVVESTPEQRVLEMLCGSGTPTGTNTPTHLQDNAVAYQMYKDQLIEYLGNQGSVSAAEIRAADAANSQSGAMGCGPGAGGSPVDLLAQIENAMAQAYAADAAVKFGNALTIAIDGILKESEIGFKQWPAPTDLGAFLEANNQYLTAPGIEMDPAVAVREGNPLVVPFLVKLPSPQNLQFEASLAGGAGLPQGMLVQVIDAISYGNFVEVYGEISWTPPPGAANQSFDVHLRALVPSISEMSLLPFAEAMCRIEVVGNVVAAPILSAYSSPNWNGESPFEYGHSQDESRTTYSGEIYALWQQGYELLLDFSAFSDVDTNYTWDATGLTGTWGIAPNGDTAQVQWQYPLAGVYDLQVTATNSAGQGVIHVRLRVVPESRAWNIRREHTSVVTCVWYGQTRSGAVWGNQYRNFGYYHLPYVLTGPNDAVGVVRSYIRNNDFIYLAGELDYQIFPPTGEFFPGSSFVGPDGPLPQVPQGLLTRASIGQQIQDWFQEARDAVEFFNDRQAHYWALLANQAAQKQVEADMASMQAEEARRAEEARIAAEAEWEFLGMHGRLGAIEFGNAFAIEWAGYWDRGEATWGGAVFQGGDLITLGEYYTDEDRAMMYEYYASQGLENYYMAGGAVSQTTILASAAIVTGGAAGGAVGSLGASGGFALFVDVAVGSAAASAIQQQYSTGEVRTDLLAGHTLIGLGTAGGIAGGGRVLGALRNLRTGPVFRSSAGGGHGYAKSVTPGGTGRSFAGHGEERFNAGFVEVPQGTKVTIWQNGTGRLSDEAGRLIEQGRYGELNVADVEGSYSVISGGNVPNYTLKTPDGLNIMSASRTVDQSTPLSSLLKPGMGHVEWAACTTYRR